MSVELYSGSTSHKQKIPESMIQKKRELHLSYSQAFGVARKTDKFRPRYSAGVHLISVLHLLIAKFREYSEYRKRFVYYYVICLKFYSFCFLLFYFNWSTYVTREQPPGAIFPFSRAKVQKINERCNLIPQNIFYRVNFTRSIKGESLY